MEPLQLLLIICGLGISVGGVFMLYKASRSEKTKARGPYVPLAITFMGLMLAYLAYTNYQSFDGVDYAIMTMFAVALLGILGIQFFIVDKKE